MEEDRQSASSISELLTVKPTMMKSMPGVKQGGLSKASCMLEDFSSKFSVALLLPAIFKNTAHWRIRQGQGWRRLSCSLGLFIPCAWLRDIIGSCLRVRHLTLSWTCTCGVWEAYFNNLKLQNPSGKKKKDLKVLTCPRQPSDRYHQLLWRML